MRMKNDCIKNDCIKNDRIKSDRIKSDRIKTDSIKSITDPLWIFGMMLKILDWRLPRLPVACHRIKKKARVRGVN
jgi:hypothetical protein